MFLYWQTLQISKISMKSCFWKLASMHLAASARLYMSSQLRTPEQYCCEEAWQLPDCQPPGQESKGAVGSPSGSTVTQIKRTVDGLDCLPSTLNKLATNRRVLQSHLSDEHQAIVMTQNCASNVPSRNEPVNFTAQQNRRHRTEVSVGSKSKIQTFPLDPIRPQFKAYRMPVQGTLLQPTRSSVSLNCVCVCSLRMLEISVKNELKTL